MSTLPPVCQSPLPGNAPRTIAWVGGVDGFVRLIDQTLLPTKLEYRDCKTAEEIWEAIRSLRVRGAPAIGVAAAMGLVLGLQPVRNELHNEFIDRMHEVSQYLSTSRPTAVNLFWALERLEKLAGLLPQSTAAGQMLERLWNEALTI